MKIHHLFYSKLQASNLDFSESLYDYIHKLFAPRNRDIELFLAERDGVIEGFFTLPQKGTTIYVPMYFLGELTRDEIEQITLFLSALLKDNDYSWLVFVYRNGSPVNGQLPLFSKFLDVETTCSSYLLTAPVNPLEITDDSFTWNEIMPDEGSLLSFQLSVYTDDLDYMGQSWESLISMFLSWTDISCVNCYDGTRLVACLLAVDKKDYVYIYSVGVLPEYRGNGLGKAQLRRLINRYPGREIKLEAYSKDTPAVRLYESHGFQETRMSQLVARKFGDSE